VDNEVFRTEASSTSRRNPKANNEAVRSFFITNIRTFVQELRSKEVQRQFLYVRCLRHYVTSGRASENTVILRLKPSWRERERDWGRER
jgi:hypothetical protein